MSFSLGETRLGVGTKTAPLALGRTIRVTWEEAAAVRVMAFATVQVNTPKGLRVNTKTDNTLGETRDVVEFETLTGFTVVRTAFAVIVIEIHGPRTERQLAVFHETGGVRLLGQNPHGHGECQGRLVHVLLLSFLIFVCRLRRDLCVPLDVDWRLAPKRDRQVNRNYSFHDFGLMRQPLGSRIMTIL
ncbi:hypothetical protein D3C79_760860 [compost metagenome]